MAHFRNPRVNLAAGKLPPFAGFGPLRHLDLQFLGVDQIVAGDAKPARGDLLDGAVLRVAPLVRPDVALGIFTALARIALAADAIHADGERLVSLLADRTVGHRPGFKSLQDRLDRLYFLD